MSEETIEYWKEDAMKYILRALTFPIALFVYSFEFFGRELVDALEWWANIKGEK